MSLGLQAESCNFTWSHLPCLPDPTPSIPQPSVGQVARVDVSSKVEVVWADNSKTIILPQVRPMGPGCHLPCEGTCWQRGASFGVMV